MLVQDQAEMKMFGMTSADLRRCVADVTTDPLSLLPGNDPQARTTHLVISMLSDVQAMIELGQQEEARQALNRAKFVLHGTLK